MNSKWKLVGIASVGAGLTIAALSLAGGALSSGSAPRGPTVASEQLFRSVTSRTITGVCCFGLGETVSANLGATPKPVVIVLNADYASDGRFVLAFKVNGGPCLSIGASQVRTFPGPGFEQATFQYIYLPGDGLTPGMNTFELCGGAHSSTPNAQLLLSGRSIALRKGN